MSIEGLKEDAGFAWPPRKKGYCGLGNSPSVLHDFLTTGNPDGVKDELRRFKNLPGHLQLVAQNLGDQDIFSKTVADHYWLGYRNFKLTHNYYVLEDGITDLNGINLCLIRSGIIVEVHPQTVTAKASILVRRGNNVNLVDEHQTISYDPAIITNLNPDLMIAFHWGEITKTITPAENRTLVSGTEEILSRLKLN